MSEPTTKRDPEGTRRKILEAATDQFTGLGLAGARVDAIASAAGTNERMLYYYFQRKEGLYIAVLESMYARFAEREGQLDLSGRSPSESIRMLAQSIWTHLRENPGWMQLINNENLHEGKYLARSEKMRETISPVVELIRAALARGAETGDFRADVDALNFYVRVVGMGYYPQSNCHTIRSFLGRDFTVEADYRSISAMHEEMLLAYLQSAVAH